MTVRIAAPVNWMSLPFPASIMLHVLKRMAQIQILNDREAVEARVEIASVYIICFKAVGLWMKHAIGDSE